MEDGGGAVPRKSLRGYPLSGPVGDLPPRLPLAQGPWGKAARPTRRVGRAWRLGEAGAQEPPGPGAPACKGPKAEKNYSWLFEIWTTGRGSPRFRSSGNGGGGGRVGGPGRGGAGQSGRHQALAAGIAGPIQHMPYFLNAREGGGRTGPGHGESGGLLAVQRPAALDDDSRSQGCQQGNASCCCPNDDLHLWRG